MKEIKTTSYINRLSFFGDQQSDNPKIDKKRKRQLEDVKKRTGKDPQWDSTDEEIERQFGDTNRRRGRLGLRDNTMKQRKRPGQGCTNRQRFEGPPTKGL